MPLVVHKMALGNSADFPGVPHFVLTYHISGATVRRIDRPELNTPARTGAISLQLPGSGGSFRSESLKAVKYCHLYFNESLVETLLEESGFSDIAPLTHDFFGLIDLCLQRDIVSYLDRATEKKCPPGKGEMNARARLILVGLMRIAHHGTVITNQPRIKGLSKRQIEGLRDLVVSRLSDRIRLSELADSVKLSPYYFSRQFKASTGETPGTFIMRIRIEQAVKLLTETQLPISEVAYQTGFSSQSHLTRRVRTALGVTPMQLRHS